MNSQGPGRTDWEVLLVSIQPFRPMVKARSSAGVNLHSSSGKILIVIFLSMARVLQQTSLFHSGSMLIINFIRCCS